MNVEREIGNHSSLHLTTTDKPGRSLCDKRTVESDIAVTCWSRSVAPKEGDVTFCAICDVLKTQPVVSA